MGPGSRGACHRARIRATRWLGRDDGHQNAPANSLAPGRWLLLRDLTEHATQSEFVYIHKWTVHDVVMWDNRQTMHRVRRYDQSQPRDMRRATVAGTEPTVAQQAAE